MSRVAMSNTVDKSGTRRITVARVPDVEPCSHDRIDGVCAKCGDPNRVQRYALSVIDTCNELHGALTGSGEGMSKHEILRRRRWLRWRLINWQSSLRPEWRAYDDAVKALVLATLELCE